MKFQSLKQINSTYNLNNESLSRRYFLTLQFLNKHIDSGSKLLDLGIPNNFSKIMKDQGYYVDNTKENQDLDLEYEEVKTSGYDVVTAFEIFEHMVAPFNLLREIKAPKLVASIPLSLWFAKAYWNENDPWDRHYHEFEPKQFDMLLNKAGWKIKDHEFWKSPSKTIGIRPLLRSITNRYYIVYCER